MAYLQASEPCQGSNFTRGAAPRSPTLKSCSQRADLPQAEPELVSMSLQRPPQPSCPIRTPHWPGRWEHWEPRLTIGAQL